MFQLIAEGDPVTNYTALSILGAVAAWLMGYAGPKIIAAVEKIAPTIATEMQRQEEQHVKDRADAETRHAQERRELITMIQGQADTIQDSAKATQAALLERHATTRRDN